MSLIFFISSDSKRHYSKRYDVQYFYCNNYLRPHYFIRFRALIDSLENNEKNKVQIESAIKEWVKNRDEKMMGIPGVGHILCATILATTGNIKNFSTFNKFYAYTGLYPKRYQTGTHTNR